MPTLDSYMASGDQPSQERLNGNFHTVITYASFSIRNEFEQSIIRDLITRFGQCCLIKTDMQGQSEIFLTVCTTTGSTMFASFSFIRDNGTFFMMGNIASSVLLGITTVQLVTYFGKFPRDSLAMKSAVSGMASVLVSVPVDMRRR